MNVELILNQLQKVKANGPNAWVACCPAHKDKSPSLTVKALADGRILLHCFAGCETGDVLGAIGVQFSDLFPEKLDIHMPRVAVPFTSHDALMCLQREAGVVLIVAADVAAKKPIDDITADRAALAAGRIYAAMEVIRA